MCARWSIKTERLAFGSVLRAQMVHYSAAQLEGAELLGLAGYRDVAAEGEAAAARAELRTARELITEQHVALDDARRQRQQESTELNAKIVELEAATRQMQQHSAELMAELRDTQRQHAQQAREFASERAADTEAAVSEHVARSELRWRETVQSLESQLASARAKLASEKEAREADRHSPRRDVALRTELATLRASHAQLEEEARRLRERLGLELTGNRAQAQALGNQLAAMRHERQAQSTAQRLLENANAHLVNELRVSSASPPTLPSRVASANADTAAAAVAALSAYPDRGYASPAAYPTLGRSPGSAKASARGAAESRSPAQAAASARSRMLEATTQPPLRFANGRSGSPPRCGSPPREAPHALAHGSRSRSSSPPRSRAAAGGGPGGGGSYPLGGLASLSPPPGPPPTPATAAFGHGVVGGGGSGRKGERWWAAQTDTGTPGAAGVSGPPGPATEPEVRLIMEPGVYLTSHEIQQRVLTPAGVPRVVAIAAVGARETRVSCHSWDDAYRVLVYCSPELHRELGVRGRPGIASGVLLTKTQMARLAQQEEMLTADDLLHHQQHGAARSPHAGGSGAASPRNSPRSSPRNSPRRERPRSAPQQPKQRN